MTVREEDRALVAMLFPQLGTERFARIGTRWTVDTYELDDGWIVQLAKTPYAAERLRTQIAELGTTRDRVFPLLDDEERRRFGSRFARSLMSAIRSAISLGCWRRVPRMASGPWWRTAARPITPSAHTPRSGTS